MRDPMQEAADELGCDRDELAGTFPWADVLDAIRPKCAYCGIPIRKESGGAWIDATGGDCCWGDDDNVNENEPHTPARRTHES